jgi:peptide/nickel transport system permease protein
VITLIGLQVGLLMSGVIITETVFAWPGLGQLSVQAASARDFPLIQGIVLFTALLIVLANLIVDILYVYIDPRVRYT